MVVKAAAFEFPEVIASKINSKILIMTIKPSRIFILSCMYFETP
jgi:hypothetical protein